MPKRWLLTLCPLLCAAQSFTVEQALSSPFPSDLTASPKGLRMAWVSNARGVRNIWIAEGPSFVPRMLTANQEDDGQEIASLSWTPDGDGIVFVRGGDANRAGENPNPTSDPNGADQSIQFVSLAGETRKLASGEQPAVSPKGELVIWLNKGQIWSASLAGDPKPVQFFKVRGSVSEFAWSPDGARVAFTSARGDHSFIGIYSLASKTVSWLDPSTDFDESPVWSPDGRDVAFRRTPYQRGILPFFPRRSAPPWSIRVAEVASGRSREIFRASEGDGSVFSGTVGRGLVWLRSGQLVFPWERTGWRSLYAVPAGGGEWRNLTPGKFEVETVSVSPDSTQLLINSNQDDIERRHLWKVNPAATAPVLLTPGKGIEWEPSYLSDGKTIVFIRSSAREPARVSVRLASGETRDVTTAPGFPTASMVEPELVHFAAADGMTIAGDLFRPANIKPGERLPAVVHIHGGSRRQMVLGWNYRPYYHNAYGINQYLANKGYIVLSINYRSGIGYGMAFREALNYGANGASEFQDVLGAGLYLKSRNDVDAARLGLWGGSYGGFLTAMGLSRASDLFAAGVDIHGVHDWNHGIQNFAPDYDPSAPDRQAAARKAWESSPLSTVAGWRSPVLLIHGDDDRNVNFNQTVRLAAELRSLGVSYEEIIFPDEIHDFLLYRNWLRAMTATADFFDRKLRKR